MYEVAVIGVGMYRFGNYKGQISLTEMARAAGLEALDDAGMTLADVNAAYVGFISAGMMGAPKVMKEFGLTGLPVQHIENASATGSAAFREAYLGVAGGHYDVAMALGFDTLTRGMGAGMGNQTVDGVILPAAFFAMWATRRMHERGTTPMHLAKVAAKNWNNGALNPKAQRIADHKITPEEVLASYMVAEPLTAMMSCPVGEGAAAAIVCRKELAQKFAPGRPVITVASSALQSERYTPGHVFLGPVIGPTQMTTDTANEAYEKAGLGPEDIDIVEVHDAFSIEEIEYYELLGFCRPGEGERMVDEGETEIGGRIPFSVDGGLIARGHPGGPTGLAQIHELTLQLRGDAGARQVKGAKTALAHMVGAGSVCVCHILKR